MLEHRCGNLAFLLRQLVGITGLFILLCLRFPACLLNSCGAPTMASPPSSTEAGQVQASAGVFPLNGL
jgi:hypothetical protein